MKFRTKLLLAYIIFVLLAVSFLTLFLLRPEETRLTRNQEDLLTVEAEQMAALTRLAPSGPLWSSELQEQARIATLRLTLIAPDGRVIGDSSADPARMPNHGDRPEFQTAISGRTGSIRRFSQTLKTALLYVAIPLKRKDKLIGVLRVAKSQHDLDLAIRKLRGTFAAGAATVAFLALFFGALILRKLTKPLLALETAATQLGTGDLSARVRRFGEDELGLLARAFNRMAGQLDKLVGNLSEEKGKLLTILATMADGVIVFDQHQRILLANRAAAEFLGSSQEKMEGLTPAEIQMPPAAVDLINSAVKGRAQVESEFEVHVPAHFLLAAVLTPLRDEELRLFGTLLVLRDLTKLRHLERVRQDFVANVSHELKTPLASVKVMAETLLRDGLTSEDNHKFLTAIDTECDRLNALVDDLLTLAKLDSNAAKPRASVFQLTELLTETTARLFPAEADRHPEISYPPDLPQVKADPDQIRQILINLLDNAAKYSPPEAGLGVRVGIEAEWVTVTVWDEGPGIPEAEKERIFERFYRLDKARSRSLGGTGLGLSIVKHLVEGYGGRVWVENRLGAEFSFTVPRAKTSL